MTNSVKYDIILILHKHIYRGVYGDYNNKGVNIMKIFFKVWNILLLIATIIPAGILLLGALGLGTLATEAGGTTAAYGGFAVLIVILSLIPTVVTIIMAIAGLKGDYEKCSKIAFVVLILDLATVFIADSKGSAIFQIIMLVVYICIAKKLQKNW